MNTIDLGSWKMDVRWRCAQVSPKSVPAVVSTNEIVHGHGVTFLVLKMIWSTVVNKRVKTCRKKNGRLTLFEKYIQKYISIRETVFSLFLMTPNHTLGWKPPVHTSAAIPDPTKSIGIEYNNTDRHRHAGAAAAVATHSCCEPSLQLSRVRFLFLPVWGRSLTIGIRRHERLYTRVHTYKIVLYIKFLAIKHV